MESCAKKNSIVSRLILRTKRGTGKPTIVKFANETKIVAGSQEDNSVLESLDGNVRIVPGEFAKFKLYPERWWLLVTVILLNLANYSHWVAFPSVAKIAAKYYDQDGEKMDLIPTVSYGFGVPFCIIATLVVDRFGLKTGLQIGGSLTGLGGLLCFFSSLPGLADDLSKDMKFWLALVGQALTGIACPFISCVPTKISQHWFGDEQRTLATILIGMSNPMGIVLGQGLTPLLVRNPEDVFLMNIIWFIPAGLGAILTMWKIHANVPPTPPSASAAKEHVHEKKAYLASIHKLLTNKAYLIMFLFIGGAMGYISCISTKIEQIMCARGYSDQLSGLSGSLILLVGFLASFPVGLVAYKMKKEAMITKICGFMSAFTMSMMAFFMDRPDMGPFIVLSAVFLGTFSLGCYPIALELVVECTYPVDQAIGTALLFFSSSVQGVFLMQMENSLGGPLSEEEMLIQSCVEIGEEGHQQPKDYSAFLIFITCYMTFFILLFVIFFKTEMKRSKADATEVVLTESPTCVTIIDNNGGEDIEVNETHSRDDVIIGVADQESLSNASGGDSNNSFAGVQRGLL